MDPVVAGLRAEHRPDALGIGTASPRLTWRTETMTDDWWQAGAEIECTGPTRAPVVAAWPSDESVLVAWPFAPLQSRERVTVRVRVNGRDGSRSRWSDRLAIEAGLLDPSDWSASFVSPAGQPEPGSCPAWLFRRDFTVRPRFEAARLCVTALGIYEAELNCAVVGGEVMAPGWTVYDTRLRYATHDVTSLVRPGANAIGATVADGWYRGRLGFGGGRSGI